MNNESNGSIIIKNGTYIIKPYAIYCKTSFADMFSIIHFKKLKHAKKVARIILKKSNVSVCDIMHEGKEVKIYKCKCGV